MAKSNFSTTQYSAENFVESAGAILFKTSTAQICLVNLQSKNEWILAKGRRNVGETRQAAALREVEEETGFMCRLLPVTMTTRCPPADEVEQYADQRRICKDVCEPFMVTHRMLDECNIKIIWWYIAAIDESKEQHAGESQFRSELFAFEEGILKLTFVEDREVVQRAVDIYNATFG